MQHNDVGTAMTVFGWDASNYDEPPRVRDGIDFYTHKAAEGHPYFYYDREYRASLEAARELEIPILGAYFVNHPGTVSDQVDWFVQILDQDTPWWREHPCFILQIDAEKFNYMPSAPTLHEIQAFGDRLVQVHGVDSRRVLAYAPRWLYGDSLTGLTYRLWASDYGSNPVAHYRDCYPGDNNPKSWRAYSGQTPLILQYGSNTTIGDQTTCDANAYRGTLDELFAELGGGDDVTAADVWTYVYQNPPDFANPYGFNMAQVALGTNDAAWQCLNLLKEIKAMLEDGVTVPTNVGLTPEALDDIETQVYNVINGSKIVANNPATEG